MVYYTLIPASISVTISVPLAGGSASIYMFESPDLVSIISNSLPETGGSIRVMPEATQEALWQPGVAEGQLSVDVLETEDKLIIIATMAGTRAEDTELHLHNDFLTIRGRRQSPAPASANYFNQECFWGTFSRTIVLPVDVRGSEAEAEYSKGILTITLPKASLAPRGGSIPIMVVEE